MMEALNTRKTLKVATHRWLRWPAVLMGSIGLWGILNDKLGRVAEISGMFRLPAIGYCYVIISGAVILFAISVFYKEQRTMKIDHPEKPQSWRNR